MHIKVEQLIFRHIKNTSNDDGRRYTPKQNDRLIIFLHKMIGLPKEFYVLIVQYLVELNGKQIFITYVKSITEKRGNQGPLYIHPIPRLQANENDLKIGTEKKTTPPFELHTPQRIIINLAREKETQMAVWVFKYRKEVKVQTTRRCYSM